MDPPPSFTRRARPKRASNAQASVVSNPTKRRRIITIVRQTAPPTPEPSALTESQHSAAVDNTQQAEEPLDPPKFFPFMKLPAELRIHIYRHALQRDTPLLLHLPRPSNGDGDGEGRMLEGRMLESHISVKFPCRRHSMREEDRINPALLRTCSLVYKEAREALYADNTFVLSLISGIHTLSNLHQRSRSLIKSVSLTIPSHHDILDGFADVVRLGLRYCWGLKTFTIVLPGNLPETGFMTGTTSIYANAFHILRWLPKGCKVALEGCVSEQIKKVVEEEGRLMDTLDETSYLKRQHQMPERH